MSGVIDSSDQQWEHCNHCGDFVKIDALKLGPSPRWPEYNFVDLCPSCYTKQQAGKLTKEP